MPRHSMSTAMRHCWKRQWPVLPGSIGATVRRLVATASCCFTASGSGTTGEARWIGWERKRGKLHELNRLLRGATDTSFLPIGGQAPKVPAGVRYVITLDADTRLPRDTVHRLIGKMAHPLNRPQFDAAAGRVVAGYAVLQPRVTPSLPVGREGSLFQRVFSSMNGIDPYAAAASDVYQDLIGEGSYAGKGIYEIDAFEAALAGRVPDSTLLSHDLFEGIFARAGLASDIEVVEEFPARYDVAARRHHRWARGDWQLLPWLAGSRTRCPGDRPLEDARQSAANTVGTGLHAVACWRAWRCRSPPRRCGSASFSSTILLPAFIPVIAAILPRRAGITPRSHLGALGSDLRIAFAQWALVVTFLGHQAWLMGDAIARTLVRLFITRRHLLEWVPAAQATIGRRLDLLGFYRAMASGVVLGVLALVVSLLSGHGTWPLAVPLAALWIASPAIARWTSRSPGIAGNDVGIGCGRSGTADDRAADLAVLRDLRDGGRPHAAAGQFPGGPGPGTGPPDLPDQSRPVSSLGGDRPRFRMAGNDRSG